MFLLFSLPVYLLMILFSTVGRKACIDRIVSRFFSGILLYIPVYLLSRLIESNMAFAWDFLDIILSETLFVRTAFLRFSVLFLSVGFVCYLYCRRGLSGKRDAGGCRPLVYADELICYFAGFFTAQNMNIFLLLSPFPSIRELFLQPISHIVFVQFLALGIEELQLSWGLYPKSRHFRNCLLYFVLAFCLPSLSAAISLFWNFYLFSSCALLVIVCSFWVYYYHLAAPQKSGVIE